jgi:hypothetical protein
MDERTLDRQIAERQGWHDFHTRKDWYEHPEIGPYESERLMGTDANGHEREVPNWQTDLGAAMNLITGVSFFITSNGGTTMYPDNPAVWVGDGDPVAAKTDAPEDIAEAICVAWLASKPAPSPTDTATPGEGVG